MPLSWAQPAGTAPLTYRVEYKRTADAAWSVAAAANTSLSYMVTGLLAGTAYQFRVRAENSAGAGAYSGVVSANTASQQIIVMSDGFAVTSITPVGASTIPAAAANPGAVGELVDVSQLSEDNVNFQSFLHVRGNYASSAQLPFSSLTVRGAFTWAKSEFTRVAYDPNINTTQFQTNTVPKRMLVSGQNTFLFT
ncbi:fibronectin type III domain-containing protein [Pseudomonas sp. D1-3]